MKQNLLLSALFYASILTAQNTIATADPVDGSENLNVTTPFNNISYSGLEPSCSTEIDLFYVHDVSSGDNKITIGIDVSPNANIPSSNVIVQLLKAVGGDTSVTGLMQLSCITFSIDASGGGFTEVINSNVDPDDDYYLRLHVPDEITPSNATSIINSSNITMVSEFDTTLLTSDLKTNDFSYRVNSNEIQLSNVQNFKTIYVFDIAGKQVLDMSNEESNRSIDISRFKNGVYIMNLIGNDANNKSIKFVKK